MDLTGRFHGVMQYDAEGEVRGRVARVQVVTERFGLTAGRGWSLVPGHRRLRDVDAAPRFFDRDALHAADGGEIGIEVGALIDLDLDNVPEPPLRPSLVPGAVSAAAGLLWVIDRDLPLLVSIDDDRVVTEYVLPGTIGVSRRIWATPTGCWIDGTDGLFRVDTGGAPRRVGDDGGAAEALLGEAILVCRSDGTWMLHSPDGGATAIEAPTGYVATLAPDRDTAVVLLRTDDGTMQLTRVTADGSITVGPLLPRTHRASRPALAGTPLRLFLGDQAGTVEDDLTLRPSKALPGHLLSVGPVGPHVWCTGHPPDGTGRAGWWPLPGPVDYDRTRQFWLFTVLDGRTLESDCSTPIFTTHPSVTVDDRGTVWVVADGVQSIPSTPMQWPGTLDVAALLDDARTTRPGAAAR
ncbi:hypothetical protein [Prescottella subtropica]|uniref:hypothetical protein n=1 Tax=Prescottella subtropica TaxID=2545757 RepID=UPI001F4FD8B3|nr:hypothetical protein [Prescottella subtropica]